MSKKKEQSGEQAKRKQIVKLKSTCGKGDGRGGEQKDPSQAENTVNEKTPRETEGINYLTMVSCRPVC